MLNIALFGPPGAGKGTQSEFLIKKYNLFYISTGDLLRKELANKTKLGLEAQDIVAAGGLVSDEIIVQIIENTITENPNANGFLFDGFPRTYIQTYILEGLMIKLNTTLNCLISIKLDEEVSVQRLLNRGITSGRSDDNEVVIRTRLREYTEKTLPVLQFYKDKGIYKEVDGSQEIGKVTSDIDDIVQAELSKSLFNIVLFGSPGSGRSTQGKAIAKAFGLEYVSTGEMLKEELQNNPEIARKYLEVIERGEFVPDEVVVQLIEKKLAKTKHSKGFLFKGFPRNLVQSYILDGLLKKHGSAISQCIELEVPVLEVIRRIDERSHSGVDLAYSTTTSKIVKRLQIYENKTIPVIEKYNQRHIVIKVDGVGTLDEVFQRLSFEIQNGIKNMR
jgi:adenylate kinase